MPLTYHLHIAAATATLPICYRGVMDAKAIGLRLIELRQQLGLSGADVCRQCGLEASRWSEYEAGKRRLSTDAAIALHKQYSVSLDWLFCGDEPVSPLKMIDPVDPMLLSIWRGMSAKERKKLVQMALLLSSK